jgi:uncharacterized protein YbjT (DUF2867 family)
MTRSSDRASELTTTGITGVVGDFDHPETLRPHMKKADRVLLCSPMDPRLGRREADAIRMAGECDVEQVVKIFGAVRHEDDQLDAQHRIALEALTESDLYWTLISPQTVMESNLLSQVEPIEYLGQLLGSAGDGRVCMVAADDCAEAAAVVLDSDRELFDERDLEITGPEALTYAETARELGRGLGRSIQYTDFAEDDFKALLVEFGMPEESLELEVLSHFRQMRRGNAGVVTDTFEWLTGRPPLSVAAWGRANRRTFADAVHNTSRQ